MSSALAMLAPPKRGRVHVFPTEKRLGRPVLDALEVYSSEPANEPVPGPSLVVTPTGLKRCAAGPHMARAASGAARALPGLNATA